MLNFVVNITNENFLIDYSYKTCCTIEYTTTSWEKFYNF